MSAGLTKPRYCQPPTGNFKVISSNWSSKCAKLFLWSVLLSHWEIVYCGVCTASPGRFYIAQYLFWHWFCVYALVPVCYGGHCILCCVCTFNLTPWELIRRATLRLIHHTYTVVAKIIRTLVFSPAKNGLKSVIYIFAVVCQ